MTNKQRYRIRRRASQLSGYIVVGAHYDHLGYGQLGILAYVGKTPKIHLVQMIMPLVLPG
jgi:hypothetical protein